MADKSTVVRKVIVGRPVRRVTEGTFTISNLGGVNLSNLENGSLLIYNTSASEWVAKKTVDEGQDVDGGSY